MKIVEFEITGEWWVKHHGDPMQIVVESFDADQIETISFSAEDS